MFTKALIPTNGVWITETYFPRGFTVGKYDAEGFISGQRWFAMFDQAKRYAETIR